MNQINKRISSQSEMSKISDDPVNLVAALGYRSNLAEIKQYQENLTYGETLVNSSDNSLSQIKDAVMRAKLLTLQGINGSLTADGRESASVEIAQLYEQIVVLSNTQINDKYLFGGFRTMGYTDTEPAPFMDGYLDGHRINGQILGTMNENLTGTVDNSADITAGDLIINGVDIADEYGSWINGTNFTTIDEKLTGTVDNGQDIDAVNDLMINGVSIGVVDLTVGDTDGLNMESAFNFKNAVDANTYGSATMNVDLTTLSYSTDPTDIATSDGIISFTLNGTAISVAVTNGDAAAVTNAALVAAVNAQTTVTGVEADIGNTTNGAANDTLILKNNTVGDDTAITIGAFNNTAADTDVALATQGADDFHNTGQVSISADNSFALTTTPTGPPADDSILDFLGLGGGNKGFVDEANDDELVYGPRLTATDLEIVSSGVTTAVAAAADDTISTMYADTSAAAKVIAINTDTATHGVTATAVPAEIEAGSAVSAGFMRSGDLVINDVDIFSSTTLISSADTDDVLLDAINNATGTGVTATRDGNGVLTIIADDGRNVHIATTANGENISHLNSGAANTPESKVYFGSLRLNSSDGFTLQSQTLPGLDAPGLTSLGMDGGEATTSIVGDANNDGVIVAVDGIDLTVATAPNGLNMESAYNLWEALNTSTISSQTDVTASLTTLYAGGAATANAAANQEISFDLNNTHIVVDVSVETAAEVVTSTIAAINAESDRTGVSAFLGDGTNGGAAGVIALKNIVPGDASAITIANIVPAAGGGDPGLVEGSYTATMDEFHNTGEISLSTTDAMVITTSAADDTILDLIGLGGGSVGFLDEAADGTLTYGAGLATGDLKINGISIGAATDDGNSDVFATASADAKANAINALSSQTGVTAEAVPVYHFGSAVEAGTEASMLTGTVDNTTQLLSGNLYINDKDVAQILGQQSRLVGQIATTNISDLVADDFLINSTDIGAVDLDDATFLVNGIGLNMEGAANMKTAVNLQTGVTNVTAGLTTLHHSGVAATGGVASSVSLYLNGEYISFTTTPDPATDAEMAQQTVSAINAVKDDSGVEAVVGDGTNGGAANEIVLRNVTDGDESNIVITGLSESGPASTGLSNVVQVLDATHNTGEITLTATADYTITTSMTSPTPPTEPDDSILDLVGLGGGAGTTTIPNDEADDGKLSVARFMIDLVEDATYGVNMQSAYNLREALNDTQVQSETEVTAKLTTLYAGSAATADISGAGGTIAFQLNGAAVSVSIPANSTAAQVADLVVDAVNAVSADTGVEAVVGSGSNGGVANSVVLNNSVEGDETDIVIANLTGPASPPGPASGLTAGTYEADATHNTGTLSYASESAFTLTSPSNPFDDDILAIIGLDGGEDETGIDDDSAGDGSISYGSTPEYLASGDLIINGVDIFSSATAISDNDKYNVLMDAINAKTSQTGITATRDNGGRILLTASDGRNLHIETSALGEKVTNLNDASPSNPQYNRVYFGSVQLKSDNRFILETTPTATSSYETGLAAIGMAGGESVTGEADDISGDGRIDVFSVKEKEGSIRYAGDRENDLDIKIGKRSTLTVSKNGQDALMDTGVFSTIKTLEEYMQGNKYRSVTGVEEVEDTTMTLAEINSEMDVLEQQYIDGWFSITVTDHNYSPTHSFAMTIEVDTEIDTPESIATKINGIPGMSASYDDDGYLQLETIDSERYTFEWAHGNANFLEVNGISQDIIQVQSLGDSLADLDDLMVELTSQIADFGARSNRIVVQNQIFDNLKLATTENLSEKQDTDILEALMQLKAKETAYQAALSAAAQTMQLSLVNFL